MCRMSDRQFLTSLFLLAGSQFQYKVQIVILLPTYWNSITGVVTPPVTSYLSTLLQAQNN